MVYCDVRCRRRAKERRRPTTYRRRRPTKKSTCRRCGEPFLSTPNAKSASGWTEYCSSACWGATRTIVAARWKRVFVTVRRAKCETCGRPFAGLGTYCGEGCRPSAYEWAPDEKKCGECGQAFTQERKWQVMCSEACAEKVRRRGKRVAKARRRARMRGQEHEPIDPFKVFERDGWRCHLCGDKLSPRKRGSYDPKAPELDHVIPLAAGGSHTWGNVACACRECNLKKGARPIGQIGLPLAA